MIRRWLATSQQEAKLLIKVEERMGGSRPPMDMLDIQITTADHINYKAVPAVSKIWCALV